MLLVVLCLIFTFLWIWLISGIRKTGIRKAFGYVAVNISIVFFLFTLLLGDVWSAIFSAILPLTTFVWLSAFLTSYANFLSLFIIPAISVAFGMVLTVWWVQPLERLRPWSILIGFVAFTIAALVFGERASQAEMCRAADEFGFTELERNTFFWSIRNAPREFQFGLHAKLVIEQARYGWSYKTLSFYKIPKIANAEVNGRLSQCDD